MARMTLKEAMARRSTIDWDRVRATSDEDMARQAREDGTEAPDYLGAAYPTPGTVRRQMGLTQASIAALIGVPVATWRNWEQGRVRLDPAVRTLLRVLWREPEAVRRAMEAA